MLEDYQEEQRKKTARLRAVMDITMGILMLLIGVFFMTYGLFGIEIRGKEHSSLDYVIGGLFALYGIWRIYRGYKKDYYR